MKYKSYCENTALDASNSKGFITRICCTSPGFVQSHFYFNFRSFYFFREKKKSKKGRGDFDKWGYIFFLISDKVFTGGWWTPSAGVPIAMIHIISKMCLLHNKWNIKHWTPSILWFLGRNVICKWSDILCK